MLHMVNQSRIKETRNAPRYKFGYRIPRNYDEAMQFDLKNGNTLWREATDLEMSQLAEYDTFRDLGHKDTAPPPTGYKKIRTHLVYDCKHDGRHKARMVADGHLTDIPLESVYSGLLEEEEWKRFKGIAKREKKMLRMVNQSRIKATRNTPRYKFGHRIPRNYSEAMQFDLRNGNTLWQEATDLEMSQLAEYDTFRDLGHKDTASPPTGYKKIHTHLVYDCKHDGRHKAQMVADGHLTDIPLESVYSGVISRRGLQIVTFLSELNGLILWATDIGNAYLEAFTMERNYIVAGPEFGQLEGHYLIIVKALYGLRTSGLRWHERFADCLRNEGFSPCKAEPDMWMRLNGDLYEYVATYVDNLCLGMLDQKSFTDTLQKKYNFKLKGTGPIDFHLGQSFSRNDDGEMEISVKRNVDKMIDTYVQLYGEKPRKASSPLEQNDHPEMDDSPFLRQDETQQFQ
jgi:hypothetical protein